MRIVITYGTFDLLHKGHIRLLERAKALGDYLIVGVTSDQFDRSRGKLNVMQSTLERVDAVRATGLADFVVIEEYEGQKIDDIQRYNVDIFTVGSDWVGHFDYLREYCDVVYLERTEGVSSTQIRSSSEPVRLGLIGSTPYLTKVLRESRLVDGIEVVGLSWEGLDEIPKELTGIDRIVSSFRELDSDIDAVFIASHPKKHFEQINHFLNSGVHVLCESPISVSVSDNRELFELAGRKGLSLVESLRTAYSSAYHRLLLLIEGGAIGRVVSIDATCTSLKHTDAVDRVRSSEIWGSLSAWGPTAMLPIFQILGTDYSYKDIVSSLIDKESMIDGFTRITFTYPNAVATATVGTGVKSEGELVISGDRGYVYVPAPWWKTDYFEIRYEDPAENKRCFYQLEGEGIREELISFVRTLRGGYRGEFISESVTSAIAEVMSDFYNGNCTTFLESK